MSGERKVRVILSEEYVIEVDDQCEDNDDVMASIGCGDIRLRDEDRVDRNIVAVEDEEPTAEEKARWDAYAAVENARLAGSQ